MTLIGVFLAVAALAGYLIAIILILRNVSFDRPSGLALAASQ